MKNLIASVVLITLFAASLVAQGIYVRGGGGYGFPIATLSLGENYLRTSVDNGNNTINTSSRENITGSFGAGFNFNFGLGYKFNENFIFEINTQYLAGKKFTTSDNYSYTGTGYSYVDNNSTTTSATALFINPSFVFSAGFGKAAPYGRFGIIMGSPKVSGKYSSFNDGDGIDSTERKWTYTKGISFGFQGAIGMNWKLTEKLDFYTEVNFISMTFYPGEYNLTKDVRNDYDNLPNYYLSQKQTIYKKSFDPSKENIDFAKPSVALKTGSPFSSLALQVGVKYTIWKIAD